jgi:putative ABC transport system substrate-binding protein
MAFAAQHGLPVTADRHWVTRAGGLMSYQHKQDDVDRRLVGLMDKILRGAKPADLPVEQTMKFELLINLKTAQALGLTISPTLLFQADEVIR